MPVAGRPARMHRSRRLTGAEAMRFAHQDHLMRAGPGASAAIELAETVASYAATPLVNAIAYMRPKSDDGC